MNEIPAAYVKANQTGIVLFSVLAILLQQPLFIFILWLVQAAGLLFGLKANAFVLLAKPFLRVTGRPTQAAELTRFNNVLALVFLTLSIGSLLLGWQTIAYVFAGMLAAAAFAAICGYCIGCTIYFQFKQRTRHFR